MPKKTVFEQVPLELVNKIVQIELAPPAPAARQPHPAKLKLHNKLARSAKIGYRNGRSRGKAQ